MRNRRVCEARLGGEMAEGPGRSPPRSAAMPLYVAPGADSCRATASALNSSEWSFGATGGLSRFAWIKQIQYQRVHHSGRDPRDVRNPVTPQ
ncbi:hypothetical protein GCM10010358_37930 [Streptomyces minutiscleroticus]|uniref:Uncharacterized protein n=1 Tax=Streptomyces minutiscleroticus TaxID=68238 RepID=A0A918U1A4_9ACTN|nr:hypothetical protein GCM10010358_37930 [Streptomyces minutiscleroticus]